MKTVLLLVTLPIVALLLFCVGGYYYLESLPPVKQAPEVPIWQTGPLRPLDYRKLSEGKITRYSPSAAMPNDPAQKGMLEACRELPLKNATARSAMVVLKCSEGTFPVSALVIGNIVLIDEGQVVRGVVIEYGASKTEQVLYPGSSESIVLAGASKWAMVGKKKIALQHTVMAPPSGGIVLTLPDLLAVFHERDLQRGGGHTIQSAEVSYEPDPSKLYSH